MIIGSMRNILGFLLEFGYFTLVTRYLGILLLVNNVLINVLLYVTSYFWKYYVILML